MTDDDRKTTDIESLARRLFKRIRWQEVPEKVGYRDMVDFIVDAIRMLYVINGKSQQFDEEMFEYDGPYIAKFAEDLKLDEKEWVLLTAQIEFFKTVQTAHDDDTSYTTDAMSVTHGDKPYEHIGATIDRLEKERNTVWYRMVRYNQMGVS